MVDQWWSWALTIFGVGTFLLAGQKIWWAWYVGLIAQLAWLAYSIATQQWGFLLGVALYSSVYTVNTIKWTRDHKKEKTDGVSS